LREIATYSLELNSVTQFGDFSRFSITIFKVIGYVDVVRDKFKSSSMKHKHFVGHGHMISLNHVIYSNYYR